MDNSKLANIFPVTILLAIVLFTSGCDMMLYTKHETPLPKTATQRIGCHISDYIFLDISRADELNLHFHESSLLFTDWTGDLDNRFPPQLYCQYNDGQYKIIVIINAGSGSGVSVHNLHVIKPLANEDTIKFQHFSLEALSVTDWFDFELSANSDIDTNQIHVFFEGDYFLIETHEEIQSTEIVFGNLIDFYIEDNSIRSTVFLSFLNPGSFSSIPFARVESAVLLIDGKLTLSSPQVHFLGMD